MDEICRFCAMPCTTLENIFGESGRRDNEPCLILILESCTELKLRESDSLPQNICGPCISSAKNAYEFKLRCEQSENYFKKLHRKCDESKMKYEVDEVCRLCTINCSALEKIFPECEQTEPLLISILEHCTNCLIRELDSLPQNICGPCIATAKTSYEFKLKSEQSEKYFMELLSEEQKPAMNELTTGDYAITEYGLQGVSVKEEQDDDGEKDAFDESDGYTTTAAGDDSSEYSYGSTTNEPAEFSTNQLSNSEIKCSSCPKSFASESFLARHMDQSHVPKTHICTTCYKGFASKLYLKTHMICHSAERPFECVDCPKTFRTKSELKSHMTTHSDERLVKCEHCEKAFKTKNQLRQHMLFHSEERPHKCEDCLKMFRTKAELKKHTLVHTEERPIKCEQCSKGFKTKDDLKSHQMVHTEERPFKCDDCPMRCKTKTKLRHHQRCHSDVRLNKCEQCSKAFKSRSVLVRHMLTHSEARPFKCEHCTKSFKLFAALKAHMKMHTEERLFECEICHKKFKSNDDMKRHMSSHSEERPFKCDQCSKTFKSKPIMKRHTRIHSEERLFTYTKMANDYLSFDEDMFDHSGDEPTYSSGFSSMPNKRTTQAKKKQNKPKVQAFWSNNDIFKLISCVEAVPLLWNVKDRKYRSKTDRQAAWRKMSKTEFDKKISDTELMAKWSNIRIQYRYYAKFQKKTKSGQVASETVKWKFYEAMTFIDRGEADQNALNISKLVNANDHSIESPFDRSMTSTPQITQHRRLSQSSSTTATSVSAAQLAAEHMKNEVGQLNIPSPLREDEFDIFGRYVASELRSVGDTAAAQRVRFKLARCLMDCIEEENQPSSNSLVHLSQHQEVKKEQEEQPAQ